MDWHTGIGIEQLSLYHKMSAKLVSDIGEQLFGIMFVKVELRWVAHKLHSSNSLKLKYQLGILKTSYINHHAITLRDHVLCSQYMKLFYSIKFGYNLVFTEADYLLHIYCCTLSAPSGYFQFPYQKLVYQTRSP